MVARRASRSGYFLAQQGRDFTILESGRRTRERSSCSPVRYNSLPGLAFPGDPERYPGRDEVAAYLTDYARHFELPVELGGRVRSIRIVNCRYALELDDMALALTERVHGRELAESLQLVIECDPQPPFNPGTPTKADAGTVRLAMRVLLGDRPAETATRLYRQAIGARIARARNALSKRKAAAPPR